MVAKLMNLNTDKIFMPWFLMITSLTGPYEEMKLTVNTPMDTIVRTMAAPDSGLEIRDRMWLKITIPNAFIGKYLPSSTVVV